MTTARMLLLAAGAAALACGLPAPAHAGDEKAPDVAAEYRTARQKLAKGLLEHAKWCKGKKLLAESRDAFERVVALEPDDAEARKALGHQKKDGRWYRPSPPALPPSPEKLLPEEAGRRREIVDAFVARATEIAASDAAPLAVREAAAEDAVAADPSHEGARAANREVRVGDAWRLAETVAAAERRAELVKAFREKFESTKPPEPAAATEAETAALGSGAISTGSHFGRVAGTAGSTEVREVAHLQPGLETLYRKAVGEPRPLRRMVVLLYPDHASGIAAISRDARFSDQAKRLADGLHAMWAPGTLEYYCYGQTPEGRRESAMRAAVGTWLFWGHNVDAQRGWAIEGVNHWFSEICLGTHRCDYFRPSEYAENPTVRALSDDLRAEGADWLQIGAEMAQTETWPGLRSVLGKDVNNLGPEGLLTSYLLARYVIEARPEVVGAVLTSVGKPEAPDAWFAQHLQATPEGLDRRLRRWLAETAAAAPPPEKPAEKPADAPPGKPQK